jgi:hypothetical protein
VSKPSVFFPINQRERAIQDSANVLLATDVYERLTATMQEAADLVREMHREVHAPDASHYSIHALRSHTAVLIDGSRGTGKSSVLVNIAKYVQHHAPDLDTRVHFLKPLDPTLLETTDDLFLNVIVAGLVCDDLIEGERKKDSPKSRAFHEQLQRLGNTLERLESQRDLRGLDKLRAFMGNQNLAQEVHQVFKAALDLVGKELLVLPIDDVDTSLNRAFDNLEVIRKYLVSPYVLPVISGDLELYNNLTWRNFHGKLLKKSDAEEANALARAKDLALEYQRKILPVQYRIEMPEILAYLRSPSIGFYGTDGRPLAALTMAHFHSWLEGVLNERTNGTENSYLPPPVKNVRSLAQLVYSLREIVPRLADAISKQGLDPVQLRRQLVVPVAASAMQSFKHAYAAASGIPDKSRNEAARAEAYKALVLAAQQTPTLHMALRDLAVMSQRALKHYCQFAAEGGPAYIALAAQEAWWNFNIDPDDAMDTGVLGTYLFQPMAHQHPSLRHFSQAASTGAWHRLIDERAPHEWMERLPEMTLVPYPAPEPGYAITKGSTGFEETHAAFAAALLLHRNFYTTNKRATLACCGRIFELVVASFVRKVSPEEIASVLQRPPFHSLAAVAATKTYALAGDDGADDDVRAAAGATDQVDDDDDGGAPLFAEQIKQLAEDIAAWRGRHGIEHHVPAPWFFYNVMNKVFNQAAVFNAARALGSNPDTNGQAYLSRLAPNIFNGIWAAIGSFEKGEMFGLPPIIAQVNVGDGKMFQNNDLFRQNIAPFLGKRTGADKFGQVTGSYTRMMADHPLRVLMQMLEEVYTASRKDDAAKTRIDLLDETVAPKGAAGLTLLHYLNQRMKTRYTIFRIDWMRERLLGLPDLEEIVSTVEARFASDPHYGKFMKLAQELLRTRS